MLESAVTKAWAHLKAGADVLRHKAESALLDGSAERGRIYALKNEDVAPETGKLVPTGFDRTYTFTWQDDRPTLHEAWEKGKFYETLIDLLGNGPGKRFRDWVDNEHYPAIAMEMMDGYRDDASGKDVEGLGLKGHEMANTLPEFMMNIAEHGFYPWVRTRSMKVHVSGMRDGETIVAYADVSPGRSLGIKYWRPHVKKKRFGEQGVRPGHNAFRGWGLSNSLARVRKAIWTPGYLKTVTIAV